MPVPPVKAAALLVLGMTVAGPARAQPTFACAGLALLNGAQLVCSQVDPEAPAQRCNFSWTLMSATGPAVVSGAFSLAPGVVDSTVFQGSGYAYALGSPVVLCEASRKSP